MPIMLSGTDWRLKEKLKIEMEPLFRNEAKAMMQMRETLLNASPSVRGRDVRATVFISLKLTLKENFGVKPELWDASACTVKCIKAPKATPMANPYIPKIGYKKITPVMMPKL